VNAVRFLPKIVVNHQLVQLPCTEKLLIRLAIALGNRPDDLPGLLKQSPALLIYSCHEFYRNHQRSPKSATELIAWFGESGVDQFRDLVQGWSCCAEDGGNKKWVRRFLRAAEPFVIPQGNKQLRKSLVAMLRLVPNQKRRAANSWIKKVLGTEIKGKHFQTGCKQTRTTQVGEQRNLAESVFELAYNSAEKQTEFHCRLQQEKLNSMKQLAYGASHEINNPLANVATRAQALISDESNPERRRKLAVIYEQAMRAHEMISDLMLFAHPPEPNFVLADIYELVKEVATEMRPAIRMRDSSVDIRRYPEVGKIWLDKTQIAVAIKALIKNSLESIESKLDDQQGKIIIRIWSETKSELAISFTDNGPGVPRNAVDHLFDPFFSGREAGRGLGFGLSKAWRISELHHGQLVWNPDFSDGAQFIFRLPLTQPSRARIDNASAA